MGSRKQGGLQELIPQGHELLSRARALKTMGFSGPEVWRPAFIFLHSPLSPHAAKKDQGGQSISQRRPGHQKAENKRRLCAPPLLSPAPTQKSGQEP